MSTLTATGSHSAEFDAAVMELPAGALASLTMTELKLDRFALEGESLVCTKCQSLVVDLTDGDLLSEVVAEAGDHTCVIPPEVKDPS